MRAVSRRLESELRELARAKGVQTAYYDMAGERRTASTDSLLAALGALGVPVERLSDVAPALREHRQTTWLRAVEPVLVAWDGLLPEIELRLPASRAEGRLVLDLTLEDGSRRRWKVDIGASARVDEAEVEGRRYVAVRLTAEGPLPWGYHALKVAGSGGESEAKVISAPRRAYSGQLGPRQKLWGIFAPLYALHSSSSWGAGNFSDLQESARWVAAEGGTLMGTLPLLATFLSEPFEPSPYSPASRLFWNELFLDLNDPRRVPELEACPSVKKRRASVSFRRELQSLREARLVDYRRQMALMRSLLEEMAQWVFSRSSARRKELENFVSERPELDAYARFRATCERRRRPWPEWPQPLQDGHLGKGVYDESSRRYHVYAQWLAHEQLRRVADEAEQSGIHLYLDLPLGVHPHGYDVWRHREVYALGASGGAPPDPVFTRGQDWGFPPPHPERLRARGYDHFISYLRHQLTCSDVLRIDHVMGLHRLFWIPKGLDARYGAYVRYRADELYAILALESHRHRAWIVGENLGTVPGYVDEAMTKHHLHRMYVLQYALAPEGTREPTPVPAHSLASLNTHDMPPFAAFLRGLDIQERLRLKLLRPAEAAGERKSRAVTRRRLEKFFRREAWLGKRAPASDANLLKSALAYLAASPARMLLINLEDLWLETNPQNVPGTSHKRPNWRRKTRFPLDRLPSLSRVRESLLLVDRLRRRPRRGR